MFNVHCSHSPFSFVSIRIHSWLKLGLWLLPLAWLWFVLIDHLRIEWSVNPQYAYGWAVPFLCAYLLWNRLQTAKCNVRSARHQQEETANSGAIQAHGNGGDSGNSCGSRGHLPSSVLRLLAIFALLAFFWLPARLIQEANPEWRLVSWSLALIVLGLTLLMLHLRSAIYDTRFLTRATSPLRPPSSFQLSAFSFSAFVFPVCFFLVAVPWPTLIEGPLIRGLTSANAASAIELLGLIGVPAIQHGNVIEVAGGVVGIDEACSGIRSFQATLMISLFLGELYRLSVLRRAVLCLAGFALSFIFNVGRTGLLTWVAARDGVEAISRWHDPAGVTILVGCFLSLWAIGSALRAKAEARTPKAGRLPSSAPSAAAARESAEPDRGLTTAATPVKPDAFRTSHFALRASAPPFLLAWLLCVELGVEAWYRMHERGVPLAAQWTVAWPTENGAFEDVPFAERTRQFLRIDEGRNVTWREEDGARWQGIFLRWNPGRIAVHLAKGHTPETCLTAAGMVLSYISDLQAIEVAGLTMPFRHYQVETPQGRLHVYYCLWEDRAERQGFEVTGQSYAGRLKPVLEGRRNTGQRSIELAVWGIENADEAEAALRAQLQELIVVERAGEPPAL
jgi:exosortase